MIARRGEIWYANLNPTQGSEQAGVRPVLIFQNDRINRATTTTLVIPFTTNLRRAALPSCVQVAQGEGGLATESVLLCHQLRVLDESRLTRVISMCARAACTRLDVFEHQQQRQRHQKNHR